MNRNTPAEIEELIANGRRLAAEATEILAAADKFFTQHNITPESAMARVRELGGETAVDEVLAKVQKEFDDVNSAVHLEQFHGARRRTPGRRVVTRSMV